MMMCPILKTACVFEICLRRSRSSLVQPNNERRTETEKADFKHLPLLVSSEKLHNKNYPTTSTDPLSTFSGQYQCMECNPNKIDSLFTPQDCVLHTTHVSEMLRDNRRMFLHKGCWPKFKGYAYSQLHKMTNKDPIGKRKAIREEFGFDVRFAYHTVRLLSECEQMLAEGDLDLRRNREHLKAIRRGDVSENDIRQWASDKEKQLEKLFVESKLPQRPDEAKIRDLLLNCLEEHYGKLDNCVTVPDAAQRKLDAIRAIIDE